MKGLLVLLAIAAVANARVPARAEKNIIDDILASIQCMKEVAAGVQGDVQNIINAVGSMQETINDAALDMRNCIDLSNPVGTAECVLNVANKLQQDIADTIQGVQDSIEAIAGLPQQIAGCIKV